MVAVAPRSTWIHCGSANALDQRVPGLPSTAAEAGVPALSVDEAVAGLPCDSRVGAADAGAATIVAPARRRIAVTVAAKAWRRTRRRIAGRGMDGMPAPSSGRGWETCATSPVDRQTGFSVFFQLSI